MPLKNIIQIGKRFEKDKLIDLSQDYWGQWLSVNDVVNHQKFLMLSLLIEKNSSFKDRLAAYEKFNKEYKDDNQNARFCIRGIEKFSLGQHNVEGLGLLFPRTEIRRLADIVDFHATNNEYFINKRMTNKELLQLFDGLEGELNLLHLNKVCHTFIDPNLIILADKKYHLILPNFHLLLDNINNNVRTIFYNQPDLQVFPLAPELVMNPSLRTYRDIEKCDVWSLGILFYLLIAKRLPFRFNSEPEYLSAIMAGEIQLEFGTEIEPQVVELVRDALKISPDQRITMDQFFERVKSILSDQQAPFQSPVLKDSSIMNIEILNFEEQQIILPRDEKKRFGFDIELETQIQQSDKPYQLEVVIKSPDFQNQDGSQKYTIECLPTPRLKVIENDVSFSRVSKTGEEGNYRLLVPFRLLRSKVKIIETEIKILDRNGGEIRSNSKSKIKAPEYLLSANAVGQEYFLELLFAATGKFVLEEIYTIEMKLYLQAREKTEEFKFNAVLRSPANLFVNDSEKVDLRMIGSTQDDHTIYVSNKGESEATLTDVVVSQALHFVRVNFHQSQDIPLNQGVPVKLTIDGRQFPPGSSTVGQLTLIYEEKYQGKSRKNRKEFPFQIIFGDRFPNAIKTIAIDFGTSNSCIALQDQDGNISLYDWGGVLSEDNNVPTFINYSKIDGSIMIGKDAKTAFEAGEVNCFNSVKRFFPSEIKNSILRDNGQVTFKSFTEIVTDYLEELTKEVSNNPRTNLKTIVFTHPINWDMERIENFRRVITRLRIGKEIEVKFVDEATAGALQILSEMVEDGNLMIFDIGGGTTDIVFGKLVNETYKDTLGERELKKFIPVFTSGFNFGGDVINEIIGMELVRLLERRQIEPVLLPFFKFEDSFAIPRNIWHFVMPTYSRIWKFAEDFKIGLGKEKALDKEISGVIPLKNGCKIDKMDAWQIESKALKDIKISGEELKYLEKASLEKVGERLEKIITKVWEYKESVERGGNCKLVLLGQSSKFEFLQNIFFHYFDENRFRKEKLLGYEIAGTNKLKPSFSNGELSVSIPPDGKSLVAQGALKITLQDGAYPVLDDSRVLTRIEYYNNAFKVGSKKVNPDLIVKDEKLKDLSQEFLSGHAILKIDIKDVSLLNGMKVQFKEKTPHADPADYGEPVIFELGNKMSGEAKLFFFLDLAGKIRWALFNNDDSVIQKSW